MNWVVIRIPIVNGDVAVEAGYGISVPVAMIEAWWGISCWSQIP